MNNTELQKARDYFAIDDDIPEQRGYIADLYQQSKQIPMQAIGGMGNLARSGARAAQIIGAMQEQEYPTKGESLAEQPDVSRNLPLPSPESIGSALEYKEPTTMPGRIAKPIAASTGAALPIAAGLAATGGLGAAAPLIKAGLYGGAAKGLTQELGAGEGLSDLAEVAASLSVGAKSALRKMTKPSGLTERVFEKEPSSKITKAFSNPNISKGQYDKLKSTVEEEVSNLSDKLLSKNVNYESIKNNSGKYYSELDKGLDKVEQLAYMVPGRFNSKEIIKDLTSAKAKRQYTPISHSLADKAYEQQMSEMIKDIDPSKDYQFKDLLKKYRANWRDHAGMFSSNATGAEIEGKRSAVIAANEVLSDMMEKKAPGSQFNKLFKITNKQFSDKANVEKIDSFMNDVFGGDKINFDSAKNYFNDKPLRRGLRSSFGPDTEKEFSTLMKDLLSQEKGMKRLKPKPGEKGLFMLNPKKWIQEIRGVIQKAPVIDTTSTKKLAPYLLAASERKIGKNKREKTVEDVLAE